MSRLHDAIKENDRESILKNINGLNYIFDDNKETPFAMMIKHYPEMLPTYDLMFICNISAFNSADINLYSDYLIKLYKTNPSSFYTRVIKIKANEHRQLLAVLDSKFFDMTGRNLYNF